MDDLLHLAQRMMLRAHAPYSKFHVGAAVRAEDGSIHGGCNVENVAFPQGTCAEAGAIAAMVAAGGKRIVECVVIGPGPELITPCGGCRQKLREFARDDLPIAIGDAQHELARFTLGELLPHNFGPEHLA
jgi:cytidine deaminase